MGVLGSWCPDGWLHGSQLPLTHRPVALRWYEDRSRALTLGDVLKGLLIERKGLCTPMMVVEFFLLNKDPKRERGFSKVTQPVKEYPSLAISEHDGSFLLCQLSQLFLLSLSRKRQETHQIKTSPALTECAGGCSRHFM